MALFDGMREGVRDVAGVMVIDDSCSTIKKLGFTQKQYLNKVNVLKVGMENSNACSIKMPEGRKSFRMALSMSHRAECKITTMAVVHQCTLKQ